MSLDHCKLIDLPKIADVRGNLSGGMGLTELLEHQRYDRLD